MEIAKFNSVPDMKKTVKAAGSHFFDKDAMKFFNSKIETPLMSGSFFVTSEYRDDPAEKRYTPRYFTRGEDGSYTHHDIGEFNTLETLAEARAVIFQFQKNQTLVNRINEALGLYGGLWIGTDKNDGSPVLMRDDGEFIHGEAFGADSEDRSGVRLYEIRDLNIVVMGDFATRQGFAEYVRRQVDLMIERQD